MHKALGQLVVQPEHIIVDGNKFKCYNNIPHQTIVKGDAKYLSIAAASVLAKTYRDQYMEALHNELPLYHWDKNKGYPTKDHRAAIELNGASPYHRKSFRLTDTQLKLDLF
jgi:ribonuclease HII